MGENIFNFELADFPNIYFIIYTGFPMSVATPLIKMFTYILS